MPSNKEKGLTHNATPFDSASMTLAGGLLVVVLVAAISLVLYTQGLDAPRTALERDIMKHRAAIDANPSDLSNHLLLASSYTTAGRKDDALYTVRRVRALSDSAIVDLTEAEVLRLSGSLQEALPLYDAAISDAQVEYEQLLVDLRGRTVAFEPPNTLLARALQGRGIALGELGQTEKSIEDLLKANEILPSDATILVALGDQLGKSGDATGAAEAYREALRFVPDYQGAREGLERLEGGNQ